MKTKILLLLMATAGVLSGCKDSFLDRVPESSYVDATFYTSDEALEAATAPLYNRAWFDYNRPALSLGSMRANDGYNPYMTPEFTTFRVSALHEYLSLSWTSLYSVITMANSVITAVNTQTSGDVSEKAKRTAIGESRLMRACAYFYLLRLWGPVILIEDNQELVDNPVRPLNREEDVFQFIINDLTYASENLPTTATAGRATCWAARGMLAKVYLARSGWHKGGQRDEADLELARQYAGDVCENSGLNLLREYEDLFKYKQNNNEESLLAMQWVPLGEWGTCNTMYADLAFSPDVTGGVNVWGGGLNGTIDMLQQYELGDTIRRNATFFTQGSYYDYICIADGGYTYTGTVAPIKKGVVGGPDDDNDGYVQSMNSPLNTYILRLADVYLTYAEACLGNNASLSSGPGLTYFNKVRTRAKISTKRSITIDDIIRERRIEFCMEYCNWYDMVSWYCWQPEKMLDYFNSQYRGYTCDAIVKDKQGYLHFGRYDADGITLLEGPDYWNKPNFEIYVRGDQDIFMPYPESDVIQNPLLNEEPVPYEFNE